MHDDAVQALYAWLAQVPRGRVVTYGQLARLAGRPNGARWVGRVLRGLPEGTALPWHRVINAGGRSSLPTGPDGSNRQLRMLADEGVAIRSGRIALAHWRWDPQAD